MGNIVAIVGRPNVGKSTLFNRLTQSRQAIVNDEAGTTRDRQYGKVDWTGKEFSLIDTGGWVINSDDVFEEEINKQVQVALDEADVILFVVDVLNGITDLDIEVAKILRRNKKPVIVVANKADNFEMHAASAEFYSFGLGDPFCVSAINGSNSGDLLDKIVETLPEDQSETLEEELPRIAIIGRPNAGKSSLINAFIGEERHIVTDIAGTTRDSIYTKYNKSGLNSYLVDTAGIRKKGKVNEDLEYYSVIRSIRAIENSDVCILMVDATRGIESQDLNIFSLVQKNKKGLVVCKQMGPGGRQEPAGDRQLYECHSRTFGTVYRFPYPVYFGTDQAAYPESAGNGQGSLRQPSETYPYSETERDHAADHRELSASSMERKVYQDQIHHSVAGRTGSVVRILCQPAAMDQGSLQTLPGKQDP